MTDTRDDSTSHAVREHLPLRPTDFYVLLALAECERYGYAIMKEMDRQSGGLVKPEIGSLYRMIARLVTHGLAEDAGERSGGGDQGPTPGRPRRFYRITDLGRAVLQAESERLREAVGLVDASPAVIRPEHP